MSAVLTPAHRRGPAPAWTLAEALPLRACDLCSHGSTGEEGQRLCNAPLVIGGGQPRPVERARLKHGGCGPDAFHMAAPFLKA